ncbi:MAG: flavodoxin family protein [Desulfobacteraceae bacterium]|nr:flavodoxin family protein [Desulfobacteraceae bacterium]
MKIIGVSCSPRKKKSTRFALEACLEAAGNAPENVETELIDLAEMKFNGCLACGKCSKKFACAQKDDFQNIIPVISDPQVGALIIASPVYFGTMTAQAKAFLDRCVIFRRNGTILRNKVGGAIAVGAFRHGGQESTIHAVHGAMLIQDMIIVGDSFNTSHFGGACWSGLPDGYEKDEQGLETVRNLGKRVAEIAAKIHG